MKIFATHYLRSRCWRSFWCTRYLKLLRDHNNFTVSQFSLEVVPYIQGWLLCDILLCFFLPCVRVNMDSVCGLCAVLTDIMSLGGFYFLAIRGRPFSGNFVSTAVILSLANSFLVSGTADQHIIYCRHVLAYCSLVPYFSHIIPYCSIIIACYNVVSYCSYCATVYYCVSVCLWVLTYGRLIHHFLNK